MEEHETYLGDSVCASFDGHMIWLRTTDGKTSGSRLSHSSLRTSSNT